MLVFSLCFGQAFARSPAVSVSAAKDLLAQGKTKAAIAVLKKVVGQSPDDYQAWFLLGVSQSRQHQLNDSAASFRKVVNLRPKLAEPHNNLAVIYNELGDLRAAVQELETSIRINPDYATAQENIGNLYVKLAAESFRKALAQHDSPSLRRRYERLMQVEGNTAGNAPDYAGARPEPRPEPTYAPDYGNEPEFDAETTIEPEFEQPSPARSFAGTGGVLDAVEAWRSAWSDRDLQGYFSAYADGFRPGKRFLSHDAWVRYKRKVIGNKSFIQVRLEDIKVEQMSGDLAKVTFLQHFKADGYASDDRKSLIFEQQQGGWKIIHEAIL